MNVPILENFLLKKEWENIFDWPEGQIPVSLTALFDGASFRGIFQSSHNYCELDIQPQIPVDITSEHLDNTFIIRLDSILKVNINLLFVSFWPIEGDRQIDLPIKIISTNIIHNPEQGIKIAFDFTPALMATYGTSEGFRLEAEIRSPTFSMIINRTTENFQWRGLKLYCKLPLGEHGIRVRPKEQKKQFTWSAWFPFKCIRSRTL